MSRPLKSERLPGTGTWCINNFPLELKNRFMGYSRAQGKTGKDNLVDILRRYLANASHQDRMKGGMGW